MDVIISFLSLDLRLCDKPLLRALCWRSLVLPFSQYRCLLYSSSGNILSSSLLLKIRCFPLLFGNVLQCQGQLCGKALQEFSVLPLTVPDVVPSLQALGLAHAAHQPPLGQIIPTPSSDCGCKKLLSSGNSKLRALSCSCGYSLLWKHLPSQV